MLLRDRIVFLLNELVGHRARIFLRHIEETGVGRGHELDLNRCGLRHGGGPLAGMAAGPRPLGVKNKGAGVAAGRHGAETTQPRPKVNGKGGGEATLSRCGPRDWTNDRPSDHRNNHRNDHA